MKIILSKQQWQLIGKKTGWIKTAQIKIPVSQLLKIVKDPNCNPIILTEILRAGKNDIVSQNAAKNHNSPPEILSEVLRRLKHDKVSWFAANNTNCPPEERSKWINEIYSKKQPSL